MLHWSRHSLSRLGRAHVAKQCFAIMFVYHATFSAPESHVLARIDARVAGFVQEGPMTPARRVAQLPRDQGGIGLVCLPAVLEGLQASLVCRYLAGDRRSWHVYWDFWLGRYPAPRPRQVDGLGYVARLLLLPVNLRYASPRTPSRVLRYVASFRHCRPVRVEHPGIAAEVAREPVVVITCT